MTDTDPQLGSFLPFDQILFTRTIISKLRTEPGQQFLLELGDPSLNRFLISAEDDQCIQKALKWTNDRSKDIDPIIARNSRNHKGCKLNRPHGIKDSKEQHRLPNRSTRQGSSFLLRVHINTFFKRILGLLSCVKSVTFILHFVHGWSVTLLLGGPKVCLQLRVILGLHCLPDYIMCS